MTKRLALVHSRLAEAQPLITLLERAGYEVHYGSDLKPLRASQLKALSPTAAIVDLSRVPSYGRYWAAELRATSMKHLPLVFVDGEPEKVAIVKAALPDATYTTRDKLTAVLKKLKPVADPVQPSRMMASTSSNATKMGIKPHTRVAVFDAPPGYAKIIGTLPEGVSIEEEPDEPAQVTLWFVREAEAYLTSLRTVRQLAAKTKLWVLYPKQKKGITQRITQDDVRESAIAVGLVDYKICSVDETWTGMAFAVKTEKRPSTSAIPTPPN
ncbi:MAG: DUF3052 family protein [Bryobacteraceae bacterium]